MQPGDTVVTGGLTKMLFRERRDHIFFVRCVSRNIFWVSRVRVSGMYSPRTSYICLDSQ